MQPLRPCWGQKCWDRHELLLELRNGAHPVQPFLNSTGSCSAQFTTELGTSKPGPPALHPSTQQTYASAEPHCRGQISPAERHKQRHFHSLVWEVSAAASAHPPVTLGQLQAIDKGQAFAPTAIRPLPAQQKAQQHKNSLTQKEKGPRFLLVPPTDRLHSLQTYNNTKTTPMSPNFRKTNGRGGVGSPSPSPAMPGEAAVGHSPPPEALNQ